jgi:uncharacterized protein (TIGR04255 family)
MLINRDIDDWSGRMGGAQAANYAHAPIQEAVIDLVFGETQTLEKLQKAKAKLSKRYPLDEQLVSFEGGVSGTGGLSVRSSPIGFHLSTLEMSDIVQLQIDRVVTSRSAPYEGWDKLIAQAKINWSTVAKATGIKTVRRVGIRYINRIDIPLNGEAAVKLSDYLSFLPNISPISEEPMTEFTLLVTRLTSNPNWTARIISTLVPPVLINHISVLFDIDLFRDRDIASKEQELWEQIEEVRALKNDIFERYLTPNSRALFNA